MTELDRTMYVAEIPYEDGTIHFRYARFPDPDETKWIRHGLFRAFHRNGQLASEGLYEDGLETGLWREFHENGQIAAEGEYKDGKHYGVWKYYDDVGKLGNEENADGSEC